VLEREGESETKIQCPSNKCPCSSSFLKTVRYSKISGKYAQSLDLQLTVFVNDDTHKDSKMQG
jgi:hypothetical protein